MIEERFALGYELAIVSHLLSYTGSNRGGK